MNPKSFVIGTVSILFLIATPGLAAPTTADDVLVTAQSRLQKQLDASKKLDSAKAAVHRKPADDVVRLYEEVLKDNAKMKSANGIMAASIKDRSAPALAAAISRLNSASVEDIEKKTKNGLSASDVLSKLTDSKLSPQLKAELSNMPKGSRNSIDRAKDMSDAIAAEKKEHNSGSVKFADAWQPDPKTGLLTVAASQVQAEITIQRAIDKEDSKSPVNPEQLGIDSSDFHDAYSRYISSVRSTEDKVLALDLSNPKAALDPQTFIDLGKDYQDADSAHKTLQQLVAPKTVDSSKTTIDHDNDD